MKSDLIPGQRKTETVDISKKVVFQYVVEDGKKHSEGLVASGRYYPCIRTKDRYYFGVHNNNRFIPGIIWNQHFIPGILTDNAFVPGVATDSGFHCGIIAFGAFIPGVVIGSQFVHGLIKNESLIPGCYTNTGKFIPSRFLGGLCRSGVIDAKSRAFISSNPDELATIAAFQLPELGYGIRKIRRYENIGGIPIAGIVKGNFKNVKITCPSGLLTNESVTLGGLAYRIKDHEIVFDKDYLPHADQLSGVIGALGIDLSVLGTEGLSGAYDEWERRVESLIEGSPGNPFGDGVGNVLGDVVVEAFEALGKGESTLIEGLNRDYNEYWSSLIGAVQASGGMVRGQDSSGGAGGNEEEKKDWLGRAKDGLASYGVGFALGSIAGLGLVGGIIGLGIFLLGEFGVFEVIESTPDPQPDEPESRPDGPSSGSQAPREGGGEVHEGNVLMGGWRGLRPIYVKNPTEKESGITIVRTDVGRMLVIDWGQLRASLAFGPKEGIPIGVNALTGETTYIIPGDYDPVKAKLADVMKSYIQYISPPKYDESIRQF